MSGAAAEPGHGPRRFGAGEEARTEAKPRSRGSWRHGAALALSVGAGLNYVLAPRAVALDSVPELRLEAFIASEGLLPR